MTDLYNAIGEQVLREHNGVNRHVIYDESGRWLGEVDGNGAVIQQHVWMDDQPVGVLAGAGAGQKLQDVQADALGTPRVVIDPVANVAVWRWRLEGEAFGATAPEQDPDGNGVPFVFDMRFPGQRFDAWSGLVQNYYREYEAATGRYTQSDPIGLNGDVSTYGYVAADPMTAIDPLGLVKWTGRVIFGRLSVRPRLGVFRSPKVLAFGQVTVELKSECINGKSMGTAYTGRVNFSDKVPFVKLQGGSFDIEIEDGLTELNPDGLAGPIEFSTSGWGRGATGSIKMNGRSGTLEGIGTGGYKAEGTTSRVPFPSTCAC